MALTDTNSVMLALNINSANYAAMSQRYDLLRRQVEAAIKTYCKWPIEQDTVTEFYDGNDNKDLILQKPWVSSVQKVWFDPFGNYGSNPNGFPDPASLLTVGSDYSLVYEDGLSRCGILRRLFNTSILFPWPSDYVFIQNAGGLSNNKGPYWPVGFGNVKVQYTFGFPGNVLLATPFASWTLGVATFTTAYAHGLLPYMRVAISGAGAGWDGTYRVQSVPTATTFTVNIASQPPNTPIAGNASGIPEDIVAAVEASVGIFRNLVRFGGVVTSEGLADYNYSITLQRDPQFMDVRMLLGAWRDVPLGGIGI